MAVMAVSECDHTCSRMRLGPPSDSCTRKFNFVLFSGTMRKQEPSNLPKGVHSSIIINVCLIFTSKDENMKNFTKHYHEFCIKVYPPLLLCSYLLHYQLLLISLRFQV
jgi:hypothetical protein